MDKAFIERKLREYFERRDDVLMAFIFGSQAKGYARAHSDWDVAVYIIEEDREREQNIWGDVENIVGSEVDLVILNRAPASLVWTILRTGVPLTMKNRRQYLSFMLSASHEANAWYHTAREYHRIFERSASLTEEDRERLERTIQFLEEETVDYSKFQRLSWEDYSSNRAKKREVERWAEQLVNAAIDIAEIVLASKRVVIPETYRMIVRTLSTVPPFNQDDLCEKLSPWVELRSILAHEYLDYRWKELNTFIQESEPLWRALIERTKEFLANR